MKPLATALGVCLLGAALIPGPAAADRDRHDRHDRHQQHYRQWERHGDIRHFHQHDYDRWRGGRWYNGRHDGRDGWWWVIGGTFWYFYNAPVYPYPNPYVPPAIHRRVAPPPGSYYYYCAPYRDYYPYVTTCPPGGWRLVPAR